MINHFVGETSRYNRFQRSGYIAGWSSPVARQAHNLEVIGSNPVPAMLRLASLAQHKPLSSEASFLFLSEAESKCLWYNSHMPWYIYILETDDGRFYTGTTNDIPRRIAEHKDGKGAKFTRNFGCKGLIYSEAHPTKSAALKREKQIQGWTRQKKSALIQGDLKALKEL